MSRSQGITGVQQTFRVETVRSLRYGMPLSIALVGLDNCKRLNDTLGHLAGDPALMHLLIVMHSALRGTDAIPRIGGLGFAILFSSTASAEAAEPIRRLQGELAGRPFAHEGCRQLLAFPASATAGPPGQAWLAVRAWECGRQKPVPVSAAHAPRRCAAAPGPAAH
jgi:diguanylate cyclase